MNLHNWKLFFPFPFPFFLTFKVRWLNWMKNWVKSPMFQAKISFNKFIFNVNRLMEMAIGRKSISQGFLRRRAKVSHVSAILQSKRYFNLMVMAVSILWWLKLVLNSCSIGEMFRKRCFVSNESWEKIESMKF